MPRKSKVNKTSNIVNEISSFVSKAESKSIDNSDSDLSDDEIYIYLSSIDKRTRNSDVDGRAELPEGTSRYANIIIPGLIINFLWTIA